MHTETVRVSWFGDAFAGIKRIIQLDADVARLHAAAEKTETRFLDHEKRLVRIETMIDLRQVVTRLPPR